MTQRFKIDFVSDVSCPWCVIGLYELQQAISNFGNEFAVEIHFQPFELNPEMAVEGQDLTEHLQAKYGASEVQLAQSREMIRARGAELGFVFDMNKRSRIYNTFDAHRLLHWADLEGRQLALKLALFDAYFTEGVNIGEHAELVRIASLVGLDAHRPTQILESDEYANEVRETAKFYLRSGINAVPAVILNKRYLIQGGQPAAIFEQALRQMAATT